MTDHAIQLELGLRCIAPLRLGTYHVPEYESVSLGALEDIKSQLRGNGYHPDDVREAILKTGTDWITKRGTWPKRLAKNLKRQNIVLDNNLLSYLGKLARNSCRLSEGDILIVKDEVDWDDGDYGDSGSCFTSSGGCRKTAPHSLFSAGGMALCLHDRDDNPVARCWCSPFQYGRDLNRKEVDVPSLAYVIFNYYAVYGSSAELTTFARILMDIIGQTYYRKVICRNWGEASGLVWINGRTDSDQSRDPYGYIVGPMEVKDIHYVDLRIPNICEECGESVHGSIHEVDDIWMCPTCEGSGCTNCGKRSESLNYFEDDDEEGYCEECWGRYSFYCEGCSTDRRRTELNETRDGYRCCDCLSEDYMYCDRCGTYVYKDEYSSDDDMCNECYEILHTECHICGKEHNRTYMDSTYTNSWQAWVCSKCCDEHMYYDSTYHVNFLLEDSEVFQGKLIASRTFGRRILALKSYISYSLRRRIQ